MAVDGLAAAATPATVAVIVALGLERASLRKAGAARAGINIVQSGPGPRRAAQAASAAVASGASALVSFGLAGGLVARLAPGSVVLPHRIRGEGGQVFFADREWHAALARGLLGVLEPCFDDLVSVPSALTTVAAKAASAADGAAAADMESAAIAQVAAGAGARFVALRVIVDAAHDSLPGNAERWIDERGERRLAPALAAAFKPVQWRELWILGQRYRRARRTLERLAPFVVARGFFASPSASRAS
jgi:adenosylhomocysteine nucleosidase